MAHRRRQRSIRRAARAPRSRARGGSGGHRARGNAAAGRGAIARRATPRSSRRARCAMRDGDVGDRHGHVHRAAVAPDAHEHARVRAEQPRHRDVAVAHVAAVVREQRVARREARALAPASSGPPRRSRDTRGSARSARRPRLRGSRAGPVTTIPIQPRGSDCRRRQERTPASASVTSASVVGAEPHARARHRASPPLPAIRAVELLDLRHRAVELLARACGRSRDAQRHRSSL